MGAANNCKCICNNKSDSTEEVSLDINEGKQISTLRDDDVSINLAKLANANHNKSNSADLVNNVKNKQ